MGKGQSELDLVGHGIGIASSLEDIQGCRRAQIRSCTSNFECIHFESGRLYLIGRLPRKRFWYVSESFSEP